MRPHDLLGRRHAACQLGRWPVERRRGHRRALELAPADREDAAAAANLFFLRRERHRRVGLSLGLVAKLPGRRIEAELVAVLRIGDRVGALHHVQPEVEAVAAEDVAHVRAADDDHLEAGFLGHALQAGRTHLARRADREPVTGNDERLAAMHARAKVGHQVAEGPGFPAFVEGLETLGDAVGGRRDLVGIDRVALPREAGAGKGHRVPEDERLAANEGSLAGNLARGGFRQGVEADSGLQPGGLNRVHPAVDPSRTPQESRCGRCAATSAIRRAIRVGREARTVHDRQRGITGKARIGRGQAAEIEA